MAEFTRVIQDYILASEGGYVDHPKDPGGATNMGITHRTLSAWRKRPVTKQDVRDLTRAEAMQIYEAQYWRTSGADRMPAGLDYAVFDYAVNSGPARAVKDLQRVLGVGADGVVGAQTLAALDGKRVTTLIEELCARRLVFLKGLSTWGTFGRGWQRRVDEVRDRAVRMTLELSTTAPSAPSPGKASPEQPDPLKDPTTWTGAATGFAAIAAAIADQPILQVAVVAGIAFLVWRFIIAKRKQDVN